MVQQLWRRANILVTIQSLTVPQGPSSMLLLTNYPAYMRVPLYICTQVHMNVTEHLLWARYFWGGG